MDRRHFMGVLPMAAMAVSSFRSKGFNELELPISANEYNWITFYQRSGKKWGEDWDACLSEFAKTKIPGFEPSLRDVAHLDGISALFGKIPNPNALILCGKLDA
jgi:inosose dehydratase